MRKIGEREERKAREMDCTREDGEEVGASVESPTMP